MKIVTHNAKFHADDLLAVAILLIKYPDAEVVRSRENDVISSADIVVDVGGVYDPAKNRFDHHQPEGAGKRDNGIPYASVGLVWKEFGTEIAGGFEEAQIVEEDIVMSVDAFDNGINLFTINFPGVAAYTLGDFFESFAKDADSLEEADKAFFEALPIANGLIRREINAAKESVEEKKKVEKIYQESESKKFVVLPTHMHWKRALVPTEAKLVVYPRTDSNWGVQVVPNDLFSFSRKVLFPVSWAGLRDEDLEKASGVPGAFFCVRDRWLAGAKSKEGAIALAEIALNT